MVSMGWLLASALKLGGVAGILVFALMDMAQIEERRAARAEKAIELRWVGMPEIDPHWGTVRARCRPAELAEEPKRSARRAA